MANVVLPFRPRSLGVPLPAALRAAGSLERTADELFALVGRWQNFLAVSGRCNENSRRQYRRALLNFWADVYSDPERDEPRDPMEATEDDVVAYLAELNPRGDKRAGILRALRSFYGWALEREEINRSPVRNIKPRKPKYGPAPSLSPEKLEKLLTAAEEVDPRARWAIQLQYATACRAGSLVEVTPDDIAQAARGPSITFRVAKGDKPYQIPLGPRGREAVARLLELIDWTPPTVRRRRPTLVGVGYTAYAAWAHKAGQIAGVHLNTHLLRHTAISRMAESPDVDVRTIVEVANWEDASLLRRYAAASDPNMRRAVELL